LHPSLLSFLSAHNQWPGPGCARCCRCLHHISFRPHFRRSSNDHSTFSSTALFPSPYLVPFFPHSLTNSFPYCYLRLRLILLLLGLLF
jgi:hypothetical protein